MWVVWENQNNEYWQFEDEEQARKHYEEVKDWLISDGVFGDEMVFLFKAVKQAYLVEDLEREEDPKEYGYDSWVKWEEEEY